ncbi:transmembrane channel-like protein 7 [Acipenser oxyrinchus oxyrinchus]|uniref:Transmembrane channel-like protein n=1 Tax=Acipenser oxyrinchus oxyrinchus TaxID=40147 RepID=A0AAD8FRT6_ACIOX|nr:transmembrane channel-like protein 7 [Acipenser oxyrinchus oxyrinchus]
MLYRTAELEGTDRSSGYQYYYPDSESLRSRTSSHSHSRPLYPPGAQGEHSPGDEAGEGVKALRELPLCLAQKRILSKVSHMKIPVVTKWQSWKLSKSKSMKKFREEVKEASHYLKLWRRALQKIGGNFGSGIQSYFAFLRFLVLLNFVTFLLIGVFVVIPNIVFRTLNLTSLETGSNASGPAECLHYNPSPQGLVYFYSYLLDLLSGTGFMELSALFYGYYQNSEVGVSSQFSYNVPLAYLLTCLFYILLSLTWIVLRSGSGFKLAVVTGDGDLSSYSMSVFCGWDFGLEGEQAARLKQNSIRYELQVELEEDALRRNAASRTLAQRVYLYTLRGVLNLLVVGLILAAFYCIYRASEQSSILQEDPSVKDNFFLLLLVQYLPSIVITAANFLVPTLCDIIIRFERYSMTMQIKLTLMRSVFLRLTSLGVLLYSLWNQITCNGAPHESACRPCEYNYAQYPANSLPSCSQCWETRVGQEMYKLMIFDFITGVVVILLVEFPRRMLVDHCSCKPLQLWGRQEFVVPENVLGLVYAQTVVWTGAFFCPLLPLINTVKFILLFYFKKLTLFQNCRPASRTFRSSTSNFFFLLVLLMGLGLACVPLGYSVAVIHPSFGCGPFRSFSHMWDVVPQSLTSLPKTAQSFFNFLGSQAFAVPLFLLSCLVFSYMAAMASVYGNNVAQLKAQLKLEGRDKQFLVKRISELTPANQKKSAGPSGSVVDISETRELWE